MDLVPDYSATHAAVSAHAGIVMYCPGRPTIATFRHWHDGGIASAIGAMASPLGKYLYETRNVVQYLNHVRVAPRAGLHDGGLKHPETSGICWKATAPAGVLRLTPWIDVLEFRLPSCT